MFKKKSTNPLVSQFQNSFEPLSREGNNYYVNRKVNYQADRIFKRETVEKVLDFAYQMTFGGGGEHRTHRSGGTHSRRNGEIFANAFQGKLAECAASNYFYKLGFLTQPDFETHRLGVWDTVDLSVAEKEISIKSTKHYGNLLLLETQDWDRDARYIPNKGLDDTSEYDAIILIRISPSCEDIMKNARLLYSQEAELKTLSELIFNHNWSSQCLGYITRGDLKFLIKNRHILPRGAVLNGKTCMDADNYYVQAGCLHSMDTLVELFQKQ